MIGLKLLDTTNTRIIPLGGLFTFDAFSARAFSRGGLIQGKANNTNSQKLVFRKLFKEQSKIKHQSILKSPFSSFVGTFSRGIFGWSNSSLKDSLVDCPEFDF